VKVCERGSHVKKNLSTKKGEDKKKTKHSLINEGMSGEKSEQKRKRGRKKPRKKKLRIEVGGGHTPVFFFQGLVCRRNAKETLNRGGPG